MKNNIINHISLSFDAISENEAFARMTVAFFMAQLNPTIDQVEDVKTAVSEAVTNAIIHGYESEVHKIRLECKIENRSISIKVTDWGKGMENIQKAMEPLYTTKPERDRSGMGFAFMEACMDELQVESKPGEGTTVFMKKR